MIISKQNNFVKMYQAMYPDSALPRSICPLFWKVIIGIMLTLISPVILGYGIVQKIRGKNFYWFDKFSDQGIWGAALVDKIILFVWFCISFLFSFNKKGIMWYDFIIGPIIFIIAGFLLFIFMYWFDYLYTKITDCNTIKKYNKPKEPSVFKEDIKSWWNKVCPLIEYKE